MTTAESSEKAFLAKRYETEQLGRLGLFSLERSLRGNSTELCKESPQKGDSLLYLPVEKLRASNNTGIRFKTQQGGLDTACN